MTIEQTISQESEAALAAFDAAAERFRASKTSAAKGEVEQAMERVLVWAEATRTDRTVVVNGAGHERGCHPFEATEFWPDLVLLRALGGAGCYYLFELQAGEGVAIARDCGWRIPAESLAEVRMMERQALGLEVAE